MDAKATTNSTLLPTATASTYTREPRATARICDAAVVPVSNHHHAGLRYPLANRRAVLPVASINRAAAPAAQPP